MKPGTQIKRTVLISSLALLAVWILLNIGSLSSSQNGIIRLVLGCAFGLLILLRPKPSRPAGSPPSWFIMSSAIAGALMAVAGIVMAIHQFEWIGLLLVVFSCLEWALPPRYSRDIPLALLLIYWTHPVPNQVFLPLQVGMQTFSVEGCERLLHVFNIRIWADGMVLHTGMNVYEVPAWCSGMRIATTVFLLGLGMSILKRLSWYEGLGFIIAALIQALALNILRISLLVVLTSGMKNSSNNDFLHDAGGIILVAGIFLVYAEMSAWQNFKRRRTAARRDLNPEQIKIYTEHPPFWRILLEHKSVMLTVIAILLCLGIAQYKSRPAHRAQMIQDVALALLDTGRLPEAEKASLAVRSLVEVDDKWNLTILRIMLLRGKYEEVIRKLDLMPSLDQESNVEKRILKAYSVMALHRVEEASAIVENLPERVRKNDPRVAMILTEMAYLADDPDAVAGYVVAASRWTPNTGRIRALYPYLRRHRKWEAIAESDIKKPYHDSTQALSVTEAYMNLNNSTVVAAMLLEAIRDWPDDPRLLEPLFFMAIKRGIGEWQDRFAEQMIRSISKIESIDVLYEFFDKTFQISRPDLAWAVFHRIREIDASHPALYMSAARYGAEWFVFRKRFIGIGASADREAINLKPFYVLARHLDRKRADCQWIPFGPDLAAPDPTMARKRLLEKALVEFEVHNAGETLSSTMQYEYVKALEIAGRIEEALAFLDGIMERNPEEEVNVVTMRSEIYERRGDWQNVYETLKDYMSLANPGLPRIAALFRAQMNLRLGLCARQTAVKAARLFPLSTQPIDMLASSLLADERPEEALMALNQPLPRPERSLNVLKTVAMYRSGRFKAFERFSQDELIPGPGISTVVDQRLFLPPAELSLLWHFVSLPSENEFKNNAEILEKNLPETTSPFLRRMMLLWLDCYKNGFSEDSTKPLAWIDCGRTASEKATALNQLTMLLCLRERLDDAKNAAELAVEYLPSSPTLWKILISLSNGAVDVVESARRNCPRDSEIWLAELVARTQGPEPQWSERDVLEAVEPVVHSLSPQYHPAAMTRAGEYLFRKNMRRSAAALIRHAVAHADSLLPSYIQGIRCALAERDRQWALECTRLAIGSCLRPLPALYRRLVEIKAADGIDTDSEMIEALRALREEDPDNPLWAEMLGFVRFRRGGWEIVDALHQSVEAIEKGMTNQVNYIVASESARRLGNIERAADLLRKGLKRHPDDILMLNNLVYTLSQSPATAQENADVLPLLMERAGEMFSDRPPGKDERQLELQILDTVAVACVGLDRINQADKALSKILEIAEEGSRPWFKAKLHFAEIAFAEKQFDESAKILNEILLSSKGIEDEDILAANTLRGKCEERLATADH